MLEIIFLLSLSAICSGLNVSFTSLDMADLERKSKLGNKGAQRILALRRNSHLTLASILMTNVAVISTTSLVLHSWVNSIAAGIISTLLIVVFGEVIPQAFFTRYALGFTAFFAPFLRLITVITYPVSKPLQLVLDRLIGQEKMQLQSRAELGLLITQHSGRHGSELDEDEIEIIRGALRLSQRRVKDIMTPIEKVYWLTPDTVIDGVKIDQLKLKGHSRIPIFNGAKTRAFGVLMMKDLVDIDFDDEKHTASDLPQRPTTMVGSLTALDTMFRKFISAHSHLMAVERDDKIVGIITIEDLLEEIIGHEIEDESDRSRRLS